MSFDCSCCKCGVAESHSSVVDEVCASALRYNKATRVTIPEGVTKVRSSAFYHSSVEQIDIPSTTTTFHNNAVSGCLSLTTINLSTSNVQFFYTNGVFGRNKRINKVYQQNRIIWIKNGVTSLTIGQHVEEIGRTTLQDCSTLTSIVCSSDTLVVDTSGQILMEYADYNGVFVKKTIGCVGGAAEVVFDNDIRWIGTESFRGLINLVNVTLNSNLVRIDSEAFRECYNLTRFDFQKCKTLDENGENVLPRYFCYWAYSLTSVVNWPPDPFRIDDYCFTDCRFDVLSLPSHVTELGIQSFAMCSCLSTVTVPKSVTSIRSQAFYECTNLSAVNFESISSVETIESMAFAYCTSLSTINLPDSITSLVASCFAASSLVNITFDSNSGKYRSDGVGVYEPDSTTGNLWHTLIVCASGVRTFVLEDTAVVIGAQSFYGCADLIDVIMNGQVSIIESGAFFACPRLEYLRLPSSIRQINPGALRECPLLTKIFYCSNRDGVTFTDDPFPGNPTIYTFYDYSSATFCGHPCDAVLDHECNFATSQFSARWDLRQRNPKLLVLWSLMSLAQFTYSMLYV